MRSQDLNSAEFVSQNAYITMVSGFETGNFRFEFCEAIVGSCDRSVTQGRAALLIDL